METKNTVMATGITVTALAALGTYLLTGDRAPKTREAVRGWTLKMKGEVLERVEELKEITKDDYYRIVDDVALRFERLGHVGAEEMRRLSNDLKGAWTHISRELR